MKLIILLGVTIAALVIFFNYNDELVALGSCMKTTSAENTCIYNHKNGDGTNDNCINMAPKFQCVKNTIKNSKAINDFLTTFPLRDIKMTDFLLTLFALLQVTIYHRQAITLDRQAKLMEQQIKIVDGQLR